MAVSRVARLQGRRPMAVFYPLGYPTPYGLGEGSCFLIGTDKRQREVCLKSPRQLSMISIWSHVDDAPCAAPRQAASPPMGLRFGVSKGVEDGRRPLILCVATLETTIKPFQEWPPADPSDT
jgi:hypothetical protein